MRRREFIKLIASGATAWPSVARAQSQPAMPVIGFLGWYAFKSDDDYLVAFRRGLAEGGYVVGKNVAIEYRSANGQMARLPALAAELVHNQVAMIIAVGARAPVLAAKAATSTIPTVFAYGGEPVDDGVVGSLNRPDGNVTGVTFISTELGGKRLSLLRDLVPQATTVAFFSGDSFYAEYEKQRRQILEAAQTLGRQVIILETHDDRDYEAAFTTLVQRQAGALIVGPFVFRNPFKIVALAARYEIPTIYGNRAYVAAGGLMSYGAVSTDIVRQAGLYTGQILKGAKPADLPVLEPIKFELVINLKTAKALGLSIPPTLLAQADEIIE
jgi:putative ABC transport system substrate-binding protein